MKIKQTLFGVLIAAATVCGAMTMAPVALADCGGVPTALINCDAKKDPTTVKDNAIWQILIMTLNIMLAGVGVLAVGGIVYAGVLYVSAGDSAEQVKKAKGIIMNVVIGLVAFGLMYSVLNWLIPGGLFT